MEFDILGRFRLVSDNGGTLPIRSRLTRGVIFALVLYRNKSLSVERLIDLLWGLDTETDRLHSLRSCLWDARKIVPPEYLVTDEAGYRLSLDPRRDHVDVDRFRRLHHEGRDALGSQSNDAADQDYLPAALSS